MKADRRHSRASGLRRRQIKRPLWALGNLV